MQENSGSSVAQTVYLENRNKLVLSGIKDILSFDEETVTLISSLGKIVVRGNGIRIESFGTESTDIVMQGKFDAVIYLGESSSGSFVRRLFK